MCWVYGEFTFGGPVPTTTTTTKRRKKAISKWSHVRIVLRFYFNSFRLKHKCLFYRNETQDGCNPRLWCLTRAFCEAPYGFDFKKIKTEDRHVSNNVREDLPASKAG